MKKRIIMSLSDLDGFKTFSTKLTEDLKGESFGVIITHVADLDGLFCALICDKMISNNTIIIPVANAGDTWLIQCIEDIIEKEIHVHTVYVTDIGLDDETHEYILCRFRDARREYIDHHSSAKKQECINTFYHEVIINVENCAAKNCFEKFKSHHRLYTLEKYIKFVNDRDLWLKQYPQSDSLASLFKIFSFYKMFDYICSGEELMDENGNISEKYNFILSLENEKIVHESKKYIAHLKTIDANGIKFGYAMYTGNNASDIAEYFRNNKPESFSDVDVLAFIFNNSISLRVVGDSEFDASIFAKARNGGGHLKAAGYPIDNKDIMIGRFIASLFK